MKRLLNTLFITTQDAYLARRSEQVIVRADGQERARFPILALEAIVCLGRVTFSPQLLQLCGENDVALSFMSEQGRFLGRLQSPVSGNVLLRRQQFRAADAPQTAADLARSFLIAKLYNSRTVLRRAAREHNDRAAAGELSTAADQLSATLARLQHAHDLGRLRGIEGDAARAYFSVFDHLITAQKQNFTFTERSRRPPLDNVNALLSYLYSVLAHDVSAALQANGLDPQVGFLHRDRPGRPGLALDLMEELRPLMADRLALTLINRQQVRPSGFRRTESGAVRMDDDTRRTIIVAYQERKRESLQHPFLGEKLELGLLPHAQALLLARRLRGDLDAYPPFLWR